jgi:hypothetical protein
LLVIAFFANYNSSLFAIFESSPIPSINYVSWSVHIGSEEAGPRVAAIVSVVETCRRLKIPIRDYLGSILPGLANFPINRIAELTPAAWLARN